MSSFTDKNISITDGKSLPQLIMLRGNSGSGKSTIAKRLQKELGRGNLYLPQDIVRREMLWVKDHSNNKAIPLLQNLLQYGSEHCEYTILEGILYSKDYQDVFQTAIKCFGTHIHAYYFNLPFEETLKRHKTKPNCDEFGEKEMREWFIQNDFCGLIPEAIITAQESEDSILHRILEEIS